jgi:hypothetical protein
MKMKQIGFGWKMKKILNKVLIFEAEIEIKKKKTSERKSREHY